MRNTEYEKKLEILLAKSKSYYFNQLLNKYGIFDLSSIHSVILFGAGLLIEFYIEDCKNNGIKVLGIADNDKKKSGTRISGIDIIDIETLLTYPRHTPIIVTTIHDAVVISQLRDLGFTKVWSYTFVSSFYPERFVNPYWSSQIETTLNHPEEVMAGYRLYDDEYSQKTYIAIIEQRLTLEGQCIKDIYKPIEIQYFDPELIKLSDSEFFVDGGAYTGDTVVSFLKAYRGKSGTVYSFEPDPATFKELKKKIINLNVKNVLLYPYALGEKGSTLMFKNNLNLGSSLDEAGSLEVKVVSLDSVLKNKKVTFIKFDIEGAELSALRGAKNIILKQQPTLAICLYHKPQDLWEIPLLVKSFGCYNKLYFRKYDDTAYDIILYALKA